MIHIRCAPEKLEQLKKAHLTHIRNYIKKQAAPYSECLFQAVAQLQSLPPVVPSNYAEAVRADDWAWLKHLILADVSTLRTLAAREEARLKFEQFSDMYNRRFSKSPTTYLDQKYNAYSLIKGLGIVVCPYCDEEYAEVLDATEHPQRTAQLDHFFPKSAVPGLAMCFFNLIPVGANCNRLKLTCSLSKSPYEKDIESCTRLFPELPAGANVSALSPDACQIVFHNTPEMDANLKVLHLEERYQKHQGYAYRLLQNLQNYDRAKQEEILRTFPGLFPDERALRRALDVDLPGEEAWGHEQLVKLRHDILENC